MKYAYFPGCSLHSTAKEFDLSTRAVCKNLDIELVEIPDWICCGSTPAHTTSELLSLALPLANCTWAENNHLDVVAPCASCFSRLKIATLEVQKDADLRKKINTIIEGNFEGNTKIFHLLHLFSNGNGSAEKLKEKTKRDLSTLKVVAYYGCLLARPKEVAGVVDVENPQSMDRILNKAGLDVLDWSHKTECCGASLSITDKKVSLRLVHEIIQTAADAGADCIAVACPLCQSNLDLQQSELKNNHGHKYHLPIFYFTQLMGLALGLETNKLGLKRLIVDPRPLLKNKNIIGIEE